MTKEEIKFYAKKYKRNQIILGIILIALIILGGAALIFVGTLVLVTTDRSIIYLIMAIILYIVAALDLYLGVRFFFFARKKVKYTTEVEGARNYCRIHGIIPDEKNKKEN